VKEKIKVQSTSIALKKEGDGQFTVSGGFSSENHAMGVTNGTKTVSKSVANQLIALYNKIFDLKISIND